MAFSKPGGVRSTGMRKGLVVVLASVVALASSAAFASWSSNCFICWKDGGYFGDDPWYCNQADDFGYRNCSALPRSCANWEPLCQRGPIADMDCYYTATGWVCLNT